MSKRHITIEDILKAQKNDKQARDRACLGLAGLVRQIAHRIAAAYGQSPKDLFQVGMVGALEGIDRFDCERGVKPTTYISQWIKREIYLQARKNSSMLKGPASDGAGKLHYHGRRARARILAQKGACDAMDLAAELDVPLSAVAAWEQASQAVVSLDAPIGSCGNVGSMVASTDPSPEECVEQAQRRTWLMAVIRDFRNGLKENERYVFDARIMQAIPGREVGLALDMTRQGVSLIEIRLRKRLEHRIKTVLR